MNTDENRVINEVGAVLLRYGADSDATMDEWVLAELLWSALRLHHKETALRDRQADSVGKSLNVGNG